MLEKQPHANDIIQMARNEILTRLKVQILFNFNGKQTAHNLLIDMKRNVR